jgi:hypothetical protein
MSNWREGDHSVNNLMEDILLDFWFKSDELGNNYSLWDNIFG